MVDQKPRVGRPLLPTDQLRHSGASISSLRAELHHALRSAAIQNNRSLSSEMEHRLEITFRDDEIMARLDQLEASIKALGACLVVLVDEKRAA